MSHVQEIEITYRDCDYDFSRFQVAISAYIDAYVAEKVKKEREAKESAQNVVCFYEQLCSPFYQIIPMEDQIKLRDLGYEIKYLPIYADQPDPTYITDWVFEVRDKHGSSVCKAHKWLYSAIKAAIRARSDKENKN